MVMLPTDNTKSNCVTAASFCGSSMEECILKLFPNIPPKVVRDELRKNERDVELTIQCLWHMHPPYIPNTKESNEAVSSNCDLPNHEYSESSR